MGISLIFIPVFGVHEAEVIICSYQGCC